MKYDNGFSNAKATKAVDVYICNPGPKIAKVPSSGK